MCVKVCGAEMKRKKSACKYLYLTWRNYSRNKELEQTFTSLLFVKLELQWDYNLTFTSLTFMKLEFHWDYNYWDYHLTSIWLKPQKKLREKFDHADKQTAGNDALSGLCKCLTFSSHKSVNPLCDITELIYLRNTCLTQRILGHVPDRSD